jgi:hypothetical protein
MAGTGGDVVLDALKHLKVRAASETPAAADMADGLRALNLMVRAWEADGIALGWTDITNPADPLPQLEYEEALGYLLALKLRAGYGVSLDPDVVQFASEGMASIRAGNAMAQHARITYDLPGCCPRIDPLNG